jgi:hypothetical protein
VLPAEFAADPDRLRRFEQEARVAGQVRQSNISLSRPLRSQGFDWLRIGSEGRNRIGEGSRDSSVPGCSLHAGMGGCP